MFPWKGMPDSSSPLITPYMTGNVSRSFEVIWRHWPGMTFGDCFSLVLNIIMIFFNAHFDKYSIIIVDFIASKGFPSPTPVLKVVFEVNPCLASQTRVDYDSKIWYHRLPFMKRNTLVFSWEALAPSGSNGWSMGTTNLPPIRYRRFKQTHTGEDWGASSLTYYS